MTATIVGIRKTSKGTIVFLTKPLKEIEGVSSGLSVVCSWLGNNDCPFEVGELVQIGKSFKGFADISKLKKG